MAFEKIIDSLDNGGIPFFNVDLINIQNYNADAILTQLSEVARLGNLGANRDSIVYADTPFNTVNYGIILSGCRPINLGGGTFDIESGVVYLDGEICSFAGAIGVSTSNRNYLVKAQTANTVQKTTRNGVNVDFSETWDAVLISDNTPGANNPATWATNYIEFFYNTIGLFVISPCQLDFTYKRLSMSVGVAVSSNAFGDSFPTNVGTGEWHGYELLDLANEPIALSNGYLWARRT